MLCDSWKVEDEAGKTKVLRFLYGFSGRDRHLLDDAVARLKALNHPGLWPSTVIAGERDQIVLLSESIGSSLKERFQECQAQKQPGVPRRIAWLFTVGGRGD